MPFWNCPDPFVKALKEIGYNIVRLPKADIQPFQILYKNGDNLERLGPVEKLLTPGDKIPIPTIKANVDAASVNGTRTSDLKIGLGVSLLGTIIGALGGSNLGLDLQYKNAKTASFEFTGVLSDSIDIIDLDQYLGDSDINPASVYVGKLLEADKLYVITAVIKTSKYTFEAKDSNGVGVKVSVPAIQGVVSGNVEVGTEGSSETKVTYEGKIPLAFGFQAVQVFYDNGAYQVLKPAGSFAMRSFGGSDVPEGQAETFVSDDAFVNLSDVG